MSFVRKTIYNIMGMGVHTFVNLVISVVLARLLKPDGVGQYQLLISTATIAGALGTFGLGNACVYFINAKKKDPVALSTTSFKISVISGLIVGAVLLIVLRDREYFGLLSKPAVFSVAAYAVLILFMENLYPLLLVTFQVKKNIFVKLIARLLLLAAIFMTFKYLTVDLALFFSAAGMMLGVGFLIFFVRDWIQFNTQTGRAELKNLVSYGTKMNLSYIVLLLNGQIGLLMIRYFLVGDFSQIGFYSRAMNICAILLVISGAIGPLLHSKWSSVGRETRQIQVERMLRVLCFFLIVSLLFLETFSEIIIRGFYGIEFLPAVPMMRILLIGVGMRFLTTPLLQMFTGGGRPLSTTFILVLNLFIIALFMMFLVPEFGGVGASAAFTIGNLFGLIIAMFLSRYRFGIRPSHCLIVRRDDLEYFIRAIQSKTH